MPLQRHECLVARTPHGHKCRLRAYLQRPLLLNAHDVQLFTVESAEDALALTAKVTQDAAARRYVSAIFPCHWTAARADLVQAVQAAYEDRTAKGDVRVAKLTVYGHDFRNIKKLLFASLPSTMAIAPQDYDFVIQVDVLDESALRKDSVIYLGTCDAAEEFAVHPDVASSKLDVGHVSRAYFKLNEACIRWPGLPIGPGKVVVDVGASPGGWLEVCIERGCKTVVGIDPAVLDERLGARRHVEDASEATEGVWHVPLKVENSGVALRRYAPFDAIVMDANMHPMAALQPLVEVVVPLMRPGGWLVLTLKQPNGKGGKFTEAINNEVVAALRSAHFSVVEVAWLWANGRHEHTLAAVFTPPTL
ncbi:S-adenosyl-L-methionine-dependent methyltransferase [Pelagophyceae sp. CCMP2097]|nr:S-adenosyl-L-methionine-dependent methyltransferase [Pelagophyceae sp. CCMP2097]|mmetsp:Transcript_3916/g.14351  ORF Transcript_3916/g.14351 Transcript_3916/m.14351 type:complete len:363 (-) Transcript_3916:17-1105(-)